MQTVSKCNWQKQLPRYFNPLSGNALYFIILLCLTSDNFTRLEQNLPLNGLIRLSAYSMHPVYPVSGNVPRCGPYFIILLCLTPDDVTRQRESAWIQYMHYKKLSDNKNINLKMPRFLWQGNLPNWASKIKRLLARHEFHLPRASGQVFSYTSACFVY